MRRPSEKKLTTSTMATASSRLFVNSCTDSCTTRGWSDTAWISTPTGRLACTRFTVVVELLAERDHVAALAHADRQADGLAGR